MFAIPKRLREVPGSGCILDVEWFVDDPADDRDMQPALIDQILLPVPSLDRVTDGDIQDALERREPQVEKEVLPPTTPPRAAVRNTMGKAREVKGRRS